MGAPKSWDALAGHDLCITCGLGASLASLLCHDFVELIETNDNLLPKQWATELPLGALSSAAAVILCAL